MSDVAHFYKIPYKEFEAIVRENVSSGFRFSEYNWTERDIRLFYDDIMMPKKLSGTNFYGFSMPYDLTLSTFSTRERMIVPTGIRCEILEDDYVFVVKEYRNEKRKFDRFEVSLLTPTRTITSVDNSHLNIYIDSHGSTLHFEPGEFYAVGTFIKTGSAF